VPSTILLLIGEPRGRDGGGFQVTEPEIVAIAIKHAFIRVFGYLMLKLDD
jgi:hypothetical protein